MSALERLDAGRIPFVRSSEDFDWRTDAALRAAAGNPDSVFGAVLGLLARYRTAARSAICEERGPTYAQLRAVADALGMNREQGDEWELLAESVALSERHCLYILGALAEVAA